MRRSSAPAAAPRSTARRYRRCRSTGAPAREWPRGRRPSRARTAAGPRPDRPSRASGPRGSCRAASGRSRAARGGPCRARRRAASPVARRDAATGRGSRGRAANTAAIARGERGSAPKQKRWKRDSDRRHAGSVDRSHGADERKRRHPRRQARGNAGRIGSPARDAADGELRVARDDPSAPPCRRRTPAAMAHAGASLSP